MKNTAKKIRRPAWSINYAKILIPEEVAKLQAWCAGFLHCRRGRVRDLIVDVLLNTGLREEELCKLRLVDTPRYQQQNVLFVWRGKGQKSRTVPISDRLAGRIEEFLKGDRRAWLPEGVKPMDPGKRLFYSPHRRPYTPKAVYQMVRRAGEKAGLLRPIHPHMFRHTYATHLVERESNLRLVQEVLGHSKLEITQRYLHIRESDFMAMGNRYDRRTCIHKQLQMW